MSKFHPCMVCSGAPSVCLWEFPASVLGPVYSHKSVTAFLQTWESKYIVSFSLDSHSGLLSLVFANLVKACLILIWGTTHRPNVGKQAFRRSVSASVSRQGAPCTRCSFMAFLFSFWCYLLISFYVCFCLFFLFYCFSFSSVYSNVGKKMDRIKYLLSIQNVSSIFLIVLYASSPSILIIIRWDYYYHYFQFIDEETMA